MPDEVQNKGTGQEPTGDQPVDEAAVLKNLGMYQPGYVETFEQANKRFGGLLDENARLGQEIGQLRTRTVVETPDDDTDDSPTDNSGHYQSLWRTTINNSFELFRLKYPDFSDYENIITEKLTQEPNKTAAKYDMNGTITNIYLALKGKQALKNEAQRAKEAEIERRRKDSERLGAGQGGGQPTPSPFAELDKKFESAFNYYQANGEHAFAKKYEKSFASFVDDLDKQRAELQEQESQGG